MSTALLNVNSLTIVFDGVSDNASALGLISASGGNPTDDGTTMTYAGGSISFSNAAVSLSPSGGTVVIDGVTYSANNSDTFGSLRGATFSSSSFTVATLQGGVLSLFSCNCNVSDTTASGFAVNPGGGGGGTTPVINSVVVTAPDQISGTSSNAPGGTVNYSISGSGVISQVIADSNGNWSGFLSQTIQVNDVISVFISDTSGNASPNFSYTYTGGGGGTPTTVNVTGTGCEASFNLQQAGVQTSGTFNQTGDTLLDGIMTVTGNFLITFASGSVTISGITYSSSAGDTLGTINSTTGTCNATNFTGIDFISGSAAMHAGSIDCTGVTVTGFVKKTTGGGGGTGGTTVDLGPITAAVTGISSAVSGLSSALAATPYLAALTTVADKMSLIEDHQKNMLALMVTISASLETIALKHTAIEAHIGETKPAFLNISDKETLIEAHIHRIKDLADGVDMGIKCVGVEDPTSPSGKISRACLVNGLKVSKQLDNVKAEIINPTPLPT